ncbi:hypothetical protein Droror1_Dr00009524 [Drosera rotundifolia]
MEMFLDQQGFGWDSCTKQGGLYNSLKNSVGEIAKARVTHVWLPPPSQSVSPQVGGTIKAFDFTTKGILQAAVEGELWRVVDPNGRAPGLTGIMHQNAVTCIDNHDTGSTQQLWPFPSDKVIQGYAYILTHPGVPAI